ncbi:MAG TPA: hypothetical protein VKB80_07335 [Kofleriaceae bacterium]|nr:hypothetical protein [Kofleriaceae bacterium]
MHDIDRTMGRTNLEAYEQGEFQAEAEGDGEAENGYGGEFEGELEGEYEYEYGAGEMGEGEEGELVGEEELDELTSELLSVNSEAELEQFLGGLVKSVGSKVGQFVRSPVGQQLGGMLKNVARQALPVVGQAIGDRIAPGVGGAIGRTIATGAGQIFGLELEGLSHEDRDFETAKQFVRLAADAAQAATQAPPGQSAAAAARAALHDAAQRFAPGLLAGRPVPSGASSGTWVRRGQTIVLSGV